MIAISTTLHKRRHAMHLYTSDLHFSHGNVLVYDKRPFDSIDAMDAAMVATLKRTVSAKDDLWIVGDYGWNRAKGQALFDQIPGRKHLVLGNHDKGRHSKWIRALGWHSLHDITDVQDGDTHFVLCHYPMLTWNKAHYGTKLLFGHVHKAWSGSNRAINVGVDCWGYAPTTAAAILERAATQPEHPHF